MTDTGDANSLAFAADADSLPSNSQGSVDMYIDPSVNYPGDGTLPASLSGQKYLVSAGVTNDSNWGGLTCSENDIITFKVPNIELGQGTHTGQAMIIAEELGVTSENVYAQKSSNVPEVLRLLVVEGSYGEMLELAPDWAYQIIKQIGNYSESYEANVGPDTPLEIARGLNALWTQGGILYAPPFR